MPSGSLSNYRTRFLPFLFLLQVAAGNSVSAEVRGGEPAKRPNLLLISIDTLRADHVSCFGYPRKTTPNIDRLAEEGHRFSRAYSTMPSTTPSHAAVFTSLFPTQLSVRRNGEPVPDGAYLMAEILNENGYTTAGFVSAETLHPKFNIHQGFDVYDDHGEEGIERPAEDTLRPCLDWLKDATAEPFFLFVHLFDPHGAYVAPQRFRHAMGAPDKWKPIEFEFVKDRSLLTPAEIEETLRSYDAEILCADWAVGELLKEFEARSLLDRTLVVLLSDHGETLDELLDDYGYAFCHGEFIHAHELHVPLVIRPPGAFPAKRGSAHPDVVSLVDVLPTVLEILDIPPPEIMMGRSLVPLMTGQGLPPRPTFSERRFYDNAKFPYLLEDEISVIDGPWQAIASDGRGDELFDLAEDPRQEKNLIEGQSEEANRLLDMLHTWKSAVQPLYGEGAFTQDAETIEKLKALGYIR